MKKVAISLHATENFDPNIIKNLNGLDYIHVDFMDGKFVDNKQNNLEVFRLLKEIYELPIIAHLMVRDPLNYLDKIIGFVDVFMFHFESDVSIEMIIKKVFKAYKDAAYAQMIKNYPEVKDAIIKAQKQKYELLGKSKGGESEQINVLLPQ